MRSQFSVVKTEHSNHYTTLGLTFCWLADQYYQSLWMYFWTLVGSAPNIITQIHHWMPPLTCYHHPHHPKNP